MGLRDFFLDKVTKVSTEQKKEIKDNLWVKCEHCGEISYKHEIEKYMQTCPACSYHFKINATDRINILVDAGSFEEIDRDLSPKDPLKFKDSKKYVDRLKAAQKSTGRNDAYISGRATIGGMDVNIGVIEFEFMAGSMGSVVGEKISRMIEDAIARKCHVITISSSGGARMQESIFSLMQMAKTSAALAKLHQHGLAHISIFTDPTTGGVTASYSMLGDVNLSEPMALICFAGPRVIEQTIRQKLPEGFQRAEFLQGHGMLDAIVHRMDMREKLIKLLAFFG
ncbi:MAG: acetyl-CoA carboxylase, carboxyltransferase subunit beta [Deferribacteraceae bacterium]|jgi:acetyl-CoA carboxylase carboxyl transferase subunit beta|nr:acetyl-CoA carboxylase, carboxyltransferase subunit beta [Deferribacteraceae bacterium]